MMEIVGNTGLLFVQYAGLVTCGFVMVALLGVLQIVTLKVSNRRGRRLRSTYRVAMWTVDDIAKCTARYIVHINYGQDDRGVWHGGYLYQIVEEPRLQFLDATNARFREWRLDGAVMGQNLPGLTLALAGLARPPSIDEHEAAAHRLTPDAWEDMREVRNRVATALFSEGRATAPIGQFDVLNTPATLSEPQVRAYAAMNSLAMKGLVEIGKHYRDLDRSTDPNSWYPTVRRRKAKP